MILHANVFQASRNFEFVESPGLERNVESNRGVMSISIYSHSPAPAIYTNCHERIAHFMEDINNFHVHSNPCGDVAGGQVDVNGSFSISGSGIARVFLRVKGVACLIPGGVHVYQNGNMRATRVGSFLTISGSSIKAFKSPVIRFIPVDSGIVGRTTFASFPERFVVLNLGDDDVAPSEEPVVIDRIVSFSAGLPLVAGPDRSTLSWITIGIDPIHGITQGGTVPDGVSEEPDYTRAVGNLIGSVVQGLGATNACKNEGVNTAGILGNQMFQNPTNIVQLDIKLLGWRPADEYLPEEYREL